MKRFTILLLVLMLLFSLVSCIQEGPTGEQTTVAQSTKNDETTAKKKELNFSETVVVDHQECMIKITEIHPDSLLGFTLKVQLENKSTEKDYVFSVQSAAINGVQCDPFFATTVAAGKKANDDICFLDSKLEKNNVGDYTDIELTFRVYNSDNWLEDEVVYETVHIYPYGEENASTFVRESKDSDQIIIDNEYVTVTVIGYENNSILGYTIDLFLVNKTDKKVMFCTENESINGFMINPYYAESVIAGKCAFGSVNWANSKLEENEISTVEQIAFTFRAYDYSNWLGEDFANELITLNPN